METIITAVFIIDEIDEEAIIESLNEWYYGNVKILWHLAPRMEKVWGDCVIMPDVR